MWCLLIVEVVELRALGRQPVGDDSLLFAVARSRQALAAIGSSSAQAGLRVIRRVNSSVLPKPIGTSHTSSSCTCSTIG